MDVTEVIVSQLYDLEPGALLYCPELGESVLCIAARRDAATGKASFIVPLPVAGKPNSSRYSYTPLNVDHLSGPAVLVRDYTARVDLSSALGMGREGAAAVVANGEVYVVLREEQSFVPRFLMLRDGTIMPTPGANPIGFSRWSIASSANPEDVIWSSDPEAQEEA